jgi:hypothetical protein
MPKGGVQTNITYSWGGKTDPRAWGPFSPGIPLTPVVNEPVRGFDFKPNINATLRPRAYEQFGFPALRAFANVELVRLAIETRKDQFERLDWQVKPVDNKKKPSDDPRIAEVTKFWRKPDGVTPFATFVRQSLEDLLALDAPAFEKRRTRGGALLGLEIVPGDTIHPMVDNTGRRPRAPTDLAFQQVIKGVAWADLTNNDLLYVPRNPRPNHLYGFGPVEQIIVTINTILRRQASQLSYFTEGNVPAGLLNAPEGWDAAKITELQQWFDDRIGGNQAEQNKLIWGPAGSAYTAFKSAPVKDEFDEWLARIVAFAFSLPPTPFIRQMNRSTGETDQERALEEGLEPLKLWAKRWIDGIIQDEMGYTDLEFAWAKEDSTSAKEQSEIDDRDLKNGSKTLDEVRDARGDESLPDGLGAKPLIYTASGAVTLDSVINPPDPPEQVVVPAPGTQAAPDGKPVPANDETAPKPAKPAAAEKLAKAAPITSTRPRARRVKVSLAKALTKVLAASGDATAVTVEKALAKLGKAEEDPKISADRIAQAIADGLTFDELLQIEQLIQDELGDFTAESAKLAIDALGIKPDDGLTNRVFDRAVAWVKERGAELVSVDGDESLIASTRDMVRSIVADGLERNIGSDAIADEIQEATAFSADRAEMIANNEVATANAQGKAAGWSEAQADGLVITKSWQTSDSGNDTCEDCLANEAAGEIPLDEAFPSGADFEPEHPRCECVTAATATEATDDTAATDDES